MLFVLTFLFGSCLGSFLNVVIDRLSTGRSIVYGRSYCEACKKTLKAHELIPVFSFIYLKGKCGKCHAKIPIRIFIVEVLMGTISLVLLYLVMQQTISIVTAILMGAILWCFVGIFFADISYGIIPDGLVLVSIIATSMYLYFTGANFPIHFISGISSLSFFGMLFFGTHGKGMGFGDVKLSFVLGLLLGFPGIVAALYIAFLTGAFVSIILVIGRKLKFFGGTMPFGPFLIGGTIMSLIFKSEVIVFFNKIF